MRFLIALLPSFTCFWNPFQTMFATSFFIHGHERHIHCVLVRMALLIFLYFLDSYTRKLLYAEILHWRKPCTCVLVMQHYWIPYTFEIPINEVVTFSYMLIFLIANNTYKCISERGITEIHALLIFQCNSIKKKKKFRYHKFNCRGIQDQFVYDIYASKFFFFLLLKNQKAVPDLRDT